MDQFASDPTPSRIMLIDEVAQRLGRSKGQLKWMIHTGTAPKSAMIAGRRCWRESDVDAFIEAAFREAS